MRLSPRYVGPRLLVDHTSTQASTPIVMGQRRRLEVTLRALDAPRWAAPTRCAGWTVHDVVAHLVTTNDFWATSARAARRGEPSQLLRGFDPAATPDALLAPLARCAPGELLARLVSSHDALEVALPVDDRDADWDLPAETPIGHVALRSMAAHALWDSWVHERDVTTPLGIATRDVAKELTVAVGYAAGLGAALVVLHELAPPTALAVQTSDPVVDLTIDVELVDDLATVVLRDAPPGARPCLRGRTVEVLEALSLRAALADDAPAAWHQRRGASARAVTTAP